MILSLGNVYATSEDVIPTVVIGLACLNYLLVITTTYRFPVSVLCEERKISIASNSNGPVAANNWTRRLFYSNVLFIAQLLPSLTAWDHLSPILISNTASALYHTCVATRGGLLMSYDLRFTACVDALTVVPIFGVLCQSVLALILIHLCLLRSPILCGLFVWRLSEKEASLPCVQMRSVKLGASRGSCSELRSIMFLGKSSDMCDERS